MKFLIFLLLLVSCAKSNKCIYLPEMPGIQIDDAFEQQLNSVCENNDCNHIISYINKINEFISIYSIVKDRCDVCSIRDNIEK